MRLSFIALLLLFPVVACDESPRVYDWTQDGGQHDVQDTGSDTQDADAGDVILTEDPPPVLSGVWALKQVLASVVNYPMIGPVDTVYTNYILVEITGDGTSLLSTEQVCAIDVEAETQLQQTVIPDAFVESMVLKEKSIQLLPKTDGYAFYQPKFYEIQGVELEDVENEPLPTEADDPRVIDQDQDGHPGLTVLVTGAINGEIYVVSRGHRTLRGPLASPLGIEGLIEWEEVQNTIGASSDILNTSPDSVTHPDPQRSYFQLVPVDMGTTCDEIKAQKENLFL